ncbi:APC family permease [Peptostreptococcus equinus]|uniref:Amino acid permease n=1 Tax=Peptostreptococcus equinus TaxID=3003601 RepID=A0ABY7JNI7_9FIRM|nr:amino acid permease [Peptostreptococcus sp. CBA3647]WAW14907.1 amino acid permease [Peptostreptococcus sp. CBA3647]
MDNNNQGLEKNLGLFSALTLVIGLVIGSGVFFKPHAIYTITGGAAGIGLVIWLLGGLLSILGALTTAEISAAIPKTGGMVEWVREGFGDTLAYLVGWCQTVVFFPATIAALAVIFAQTSIILLGVGESFVLPIAIFTIIFLATLNTISVKLGNGIQVIASVVKLIPLAIIIVVGLIKGPSVGNGVANLSPFMAQGASLPSVLAGGVLATLFAYQGWIDAGAVAGEMKKPEKDLPIALIGGLLIIIAIYTIINVAYLFVVPADVMMKSDAPAALVANALFGRVGGTLITGGILISVFGCCGANLFTGSRQPYALAQTNSIPFSKTFGSTTKNGTPAASTVLITIISCIFALSGQFDFLTNIAVTTIWIFYILTFASVMILRKRQPELHRPYKVPMYPLVPILAIAGGLFVVINQIVTNPGQSFIGIGVTLLGLPIYWYMKKKNA